MLDIFHGYASDRKLRLFAVACCRKIYHFVPTRTQQTIEVTEQFVEGCVMRDALIRARRQGAVSHALPPEEGPDTRESRLVTVNTAAALAHADSYVWFSAATDSDQGRSRAYASPVERREFTLADGTWEWARHGTRFVAGTVQAALLRDIAGVLPFRSLTADSSWLAWNNGTVPNLAQAIYTGRAFDRMPILADALEDAGCTNQDILNHCRGGGEHVRGCWVVDLLLAKQ